MYICGICGKEHETFEAYSQCAVGCITKKKAAAEAEKKKQLEAEKEVRLAEIRAVRKQLNALEKKFAEDYGYGQSGKLRAPFDSFFESLF